MSDCIFCKIISGDIPSNKVYENNSVLAFYDISPKAPVHVVLIPKVHMEDFLHAADDPEVIQAMAQGVKEVAKVLDLEENGFRLVSNIGRDGGQSVYHLHYHILAGKRFGEDFG